MVLMKMLKTKNIPSNGLGCYSLKLQGTIYPVSLSDIRLGKLVEGEDFILLNAEPTNFEELEKMSSLTSAVIGSESNVYQTIKTRQRKNDTVRNKRAVA